MNDIKEIIVQIADEKLLEIQDKGYISQGNNGPYYCKDTPARNSSHWIGIYKYLWNTTRDKKYLEAVEILANYLCSEKFKSKSGAIKCIEDNKRMDYINGSIGQAWIIEGLINAYDILKDIKYYNKAVKVFLSQTYDYEKHLWNRIELSCENIGIDKVFNHQLWFAASGFLIVKANENIEISNQINDFMKNADNLFNIYNSGLFKHYVKGYERKEERSLKMFIRKAFAMFAFIDPRFDKYYFEKGYHLFDLYGFAIIYSCNNNFEIFKSEKMLKAITYGINIEELNKGFNVKYFKKDKKVNLFKYNKYAYSYNSPAFEYPFIDYIFNNGCNKEKYYNELFNIQILMTYDKNKKKFSRNTNDPETLTSRLYELTRYLELEKCNEKK